MDPLFPTSRGPHDARQKSLVTTSRWASLRLRVFTRCALGQPGGQWVGAHLYHLAPMGTQNGKPGRPRDPHADEAILAAARDLLAEGGLANLTVEGTAQRAGVAKTTVYRRYPTKLDLAVAAVADLVSGGAGI